MMTNAKEGIEKVAQGTVSKERFLRKYMKFLAHCEPFFVETCVSRRLLPTRPEVDSEIRSTPEMLALLEAVKQLDFPFEIDPEFSRFPDPIISSAKNPPKKPVKIQQPKPPVSKARIKEAIDLQTNRQRAKELQERRRNGLD